MKYTARIGILATVFLFFFFIDTIKGESISGFHPNSRLEVEILGDKNYPPFEFINDKGMPDGFDIDLLGTALKRLGIPYTVNLNTWDEPKNIQRKGRKILFFMARNEERNQKYAFGPTVKYLTLSIIYNKGKDHYGSLRELNGKDVFVEKMSNTYFQLKKRQIRCRYLECNLDDGLKSLNAGKGDACVCSREVATFYIKKFGLKNLIVIDADITPLDYHLAGFDSTTIRFVAIELSKMQLDGTYNALYDKWFNTESTADHISHIVYIILGCLVLLVGILHTFINTLRKKVRKSGAQLTEKNTYLRMALHAGKIGVWGYDVKRRWLYNIDYDYFPPEGVSVDEELLKYHPKDRLVLGKTMMDAENGILPKKAICVRMREDENKDWRYIEKEISVVRDEDGKVTQIIGTHKDITEQMHTHNRMKEYEQRMNYVLSVSHTITWIYKIQEDRFYGYINGDQQYSELSGEEYCRRCRPEDYAAAVEHVRKMQNAVMEPFKLEHWAAIDEDGKVRAYYVINGVPVRDSDDKVTYYFGICTDITHLITIQHQLEEEKVNAQRADKLKSSFLANMSHEIRTPLNSIVGFSNVLENASSKEDKEQCIFYINKNTEILLALINDILDFSKMEAGTMEYHIKEFDLSALYQTINKSLAHLAEGKDAQWIVDVPYPTCVIDSDPQRIQQVLTNFITNAFKYTEHGYVKMSYTLTGGGIRMTVEDTGSGITEEDQQHVFERFKKLDPFKQGTGLGLSICKSIATMLHGNVGVESTLGKGSIFWIWLPVRPKA